MNTGHPDPSPRSGPLGLAVHTDLPGQAGVSTEPELGGRAGQLEGQHRGKLHHPKKKKKRKKLRKVQNLPLENLGIKGAASAPAFLASSVAATGRSSRQGLPFCNLLSQEAA